ncbi:hypothetical protein FFLO_01716 [Filobasidium floriforme]|uniref:CSN8/PSMD8/EIF3K domain-containing protein n=1 Tax=Filobasidium floriforme TaxID=5210 RepID=A0A8K0JQ90_9TREE|nr:SAC3/GANP/Nin1/mts3/eIF-3 p25 family-domain-containing protein [Filobasidium floriforme]KAG7562887.1 hypothetical protein FFLO_01716 [Filobasidium floriforme]KAH8086421.1 SAC3/GANP/Nin1/mts3/eIF-3 p25 family-domain-containing protein [Filobasidium floriforme]
MPNQQLKQGLTSLQQAYDSGDVAGAGKQLTQLKIALARAGLLSPNGQQDKEDLLTARSILEIGAFYSLKVRDVSAFARYEAMLSGYYRDFKAILPPSTSQPPLLGLSLLSLLASSRIADFHTVLETLDEQMMNDVYVRWPIDLERWLMEGSYTKVWRARERVPREEYGVLLEGLVGTIRSEIASCHEKAYATLPLADATRLLFFKNESETVEFGQGRGWSFSPTTREFGLARVLNNPGSSFTDGPTGSAGAGLSGDGPIAKERLIKTSLDYATELEAIV